MRQRSVQRVGAAATGLVVSVLAAACSSSSPAPSASGAPAPPTGGPSGGGASAAPQAGQSPVPVESNPPGDISDSIAYVAYRNAAGRYSFQHPEGWASVGNGTTARFTDKLNGIVASPGPATAPPTVDQARTAEASRLSASQPAFELRRVAVTQLPAGSGVLIVYRRNSAPDPVTGRMYRDEVERYEVVGHGHEIILELSGPAGADNVDPYAKITRSLTLW